MGPFFSGSINYRRRLVFWLQVCSFLIWFVGCNSQSESTASKLDLPEHIQKLDSLTVYSTHAQAPDTVEFVQKTVFESNENVFFNGYTGEVAIDEQDRVYVVAQKPGSVGVYVFNPDGSFRTKFLREGRGPGEFESIGSMIIKNGKIYIFGPRLQKIGIFSQDDYSLVDDYKIGRDAFNNDKLLKLLRAYELSAVENDGRMLMKFVDNMASNENREISYFRLSDKANVLPGKILNLKKYRYYNVEMKRGSNGNPTLPFTTPFGRSTLVAVADQGPIYTAWTEDFLIKKYDRRGNYLGAFYYPVEKHPLSLSGVDMSDMRKEIVADHYVPETWPALHNMVVDDQGRFWAFTITDSDSTYKGWVLKPSGELLARFTWAGSRDDRSVRWSQPFKIKNGYLYTRERDISNGIDRIVKERISMHPPIYEKNRN